MKSIKFLLSVCIIAIAVSACEKPEAAVEIPFDYNTMVQGSWTETYKSVVKSTDTSATGDTVQSPKGKYVQKFFEGKVSYYTLNKLQKTRKFNYDGTKLYIFDSTQADGNVEDYKVTLEETKMKLFRERKTSNGVIYFTETTNITLEKY